jgi:Flp pilus assembly protein TadD
LESDHADSHLRLATLLRFRGDWTGAESEFRRAIEFDPNEALAYNGLADVLRRVGYPEAAKSEALFCLD